MKLSRREAPKRQLSQMKLTESVIEFIQGISVIKAFNMDDKTIFFKLLVLFFDVRT